MIKLSAEASVIRTNVFNDLEDEVLSITEASGYQYKIETLQHPSGPYVFSVWVCATNSDTVTGSQSQFAVDLFGQHETFTIQVNTKINEDGTIENVWHKIVMYYDSDNGGWSDTDTSEKYIVITPLDDMTLYFYEAMLEQATKASGWSPAPEDTEYDIGEVADDVFSLEERMTSAEQKITDDAIVATVQKSEMYTNLVTGQQAINSSVTTLEQTANGFRASIEELSDGFDDLNKNVTSTITFTQDGLVLGKSDSTMKAELSNDKLAFTDNGTEVAYISDSKMYISEAEVLSTMKIGKFAFVPTDTGMALVYVG